VSEAEAGRLQVRSGLRFVQILRLALYALLVLSAGFAFWAGGDIAGHALPEWTQIAAPVVFAVFLVVFAVYRLTLVRARRYAASVGLFQIGLGALIWVLLLPGTRQKMEAPRGARDSVPALLSSGDPRVRALAAEVAGTRSNGARYADGLIDRLTDRDARVRLAAHAALVRLAGSDAAPGLEREAAAARWREFARGRGWGVAAP
jgi:hypothetical protein